MGFLAWFKGEEAPPPQKQRHSRDLPKVADEVLNVPDRFSTHTPKCAPPEEGYRVYGSIYMTNGSPYLSIKIESEIMAELGWQVGEQVCPHYLEDTNEVFLERVTGFSSRRLYTLSVSDSQDKKWLGKIPVDARIRVPISDIPWVLQEKRTQVPVEYLLESGGVSVTLPPQLLSGAI